jgi:hypothetical protein
MSVLLRCGSPRRLQVVLGPALVGLVVAPSATPPPDPQRRWRGRNVVSLLGGAARRGALLVAAATAALLLVGVSGASAQGTLDQSVTAGSGGGVGVWGTERLGQTFTAGITGTLSQVDLDLLTSLDPAPLSVDIESVDANGHPSGTVLAATTVTSSLVPGPTTWVSLPLSDGPIVVAGTRYAIVLADPADPVGGSKIWADEFANPNPYSGGDVQLSGDSGSTWLDQPAFSLLFRTYVESISRERCKNGGWRNFPQFTNQGQCVSFVENGK